jgi:hypothetical protein
VIDLLDKLKIGAIVHVPSSAFPNDPAPPEGYWIGKLCNTLQGGTGDIGVHIEGEEIFTQSRMTLIKQVAAAGAACEEAEGDAARVGRDRPA